MAGKPQGRWSLSLLAIAGLFLIVLHFDKELQRLLVEALIQWLLRM